MNVGPNYKTGPVEKHIGYKKNIRLYSPFSHETFRRSAIYVEQETEIGERHFMRSLVLATMFMAVVSTAASAETLLERGTYLVEGIMACGTCHARPGQESAAIPGDLAGGVRFRIRGKVVYAANITPDRETGVGAWSDEEIIRAIMIGVRPGGMRIGGMPFELYRDITERDAKAIVAYLRSLRPVKNDVPKNFQPLTETGKRMRIRSLPDLPQGNAVRYGAYLAGPLGRCIECHTPRNEDGRPDYVKMLGAGGVEFSGSWGQSVSGNLTPDPDTGLGEFTDDQIKEMIVRGRRPDKSYVGRPMAHTYYQRISPQDLNAIIAYLRSLKPIKNFIDK